MCILRFVESLQVLDPDFKVAQVTNIITAVVAAACKCELPEYPITSGTFKCFPGSNDAVFYRAKLLIVPLANSSFLLKIIEDWVSQKSSFALSGTIVSVDNTCEVAIAFEACECMCVEQIHPTTLNDSVIAAAVLSPVFLILIVLALVLFIAVLLVRKHKRGILWIGREER